MKKLLAPVDFSDRALAALEHAAVLAKALHASTLLLHVVPSLSEWELQAMDLRLVGGSAEMKRKRFEAVTNQIKELASKAGLEGDIRVCEGDPVRAILQMAEEECVDLIVMPTHGHGPFRRFLLGSVTAKVLHDADCPVFTGAHVPQIEPGSAAPYQRIVCAVDLGEHSEGVLRAAADFAAAFHAELTVFHALPFFEFIGLDQELILGAAAESLRESLAASLSNAEKKLAALIQTVGCKAEMRVENALVTQAARAIVDETKADLLVIGRAAKGLGRLRSNAYALIRESPCPVISV
jgi:nucleotide-binding universal stress UspA family protein